jgi:AcrR family transcriptional regulator
MPKVVDPTIQREAIRSAARNVFAQRGVRGTGLAHVAEVAGMARSSLYHYYPDKESLLEDLVSEMLDQELRLFRTFLRTEGPPALRLERLARACAAAVQEWSEFGRLIVDLRLEDAKRLKSFFRSLRRETAAVIREGQEDGSMAATPDAEVMASIWIGAIDGLLLQYFVDARALPSRKPLADALVAMTRRLVGA